MALCTSVSKADSVEASILPNGIQTVAKRDDVFNVLQARLQEQSKDILHCVDARLEKQLEALVKQWHTHKADIGLMLDSKLQHWCSRHADAINVPIPPDMDDLNGEEDTETSALKADADELVKQRATMLQEYIEICGWKAEPSREPPMRMQSRKQGDLVGFEAQSQCQTILAFIVHSAIFQSVSALLVIANSAMIAVQLDLDLQRALAGKDNLPWEQYSDLSFTLVFFVELILKLCAERRHFYRGPGRYWNWFDVVVVATGLIDLLQVINFSLTFLRILRILRMIRVLRILRIFKFCRELRLMALSIVSCLRSLVWAFLLLLMSFFIFSLVLLESARNYLRGESVDELVRGDLAEHYSGVFMSIYTLIQSVSGGNSWGDVAECFVSISWTYGVAFTAFIIFVMFGLLNVLVGVFVQNTESIAGIDREFVIQEEMDRKNSLINQMRQLFKEVDADNSGTITWKELSEKMHDNSMKAYFSTMEIDTDEAQGLFKLLDTDESGEVAIEEFIMGCMRLKGTAKSIDLASMLYENKKLHSMLHKYMDSMSSKLYQIERLILKQRQVAKKEAVSNLPQYGSTLKQ